MNRKRQNLKPPKPARRGASSKKEETVLAARDFLNQILRAGGASWFEHGGVRIGAVWMQVLTRDEAQEWLNQVDEEHQRKRQDSKVRVYASEIDQNHFRAGVPVIIFDHRARLINGQHILGGFLRSSAEVIIVTVQINLGDKAYQAIDENKKRSATDTLRWNGVDRPADVARVAGILHQYIKGYYTNKGYLGARNADKLPTNAEVEAIQKHYPMIPQHLWKDPGTGGYSLPAMRAASVILAQIDPTYHQKFFTSLIEGVGIYDPKEPVAVLRAALIKAHQSANDRGGWRHGETMLRIFKAWNASVRGEALSGPLYRKGEPFQDPTDVVAAIPESTRSSARRVQ
jgi:hypothetical protein